MNINSIIVSCSPDHYECISSFCQFRICVFPCESCRIAEMGDSRLGTLGRGPWSKLKCVDSNRSVTSR